MTIRLLLLSEIIPGPTADGDNGTRALTIVPDAVTFAREIRDGDGGYRSFGARTLVGLVDGSVRRITMELPAFTEALGMALSGAPMQTDGAIQSGEAMTTASTPLEALLGDLFGGEDDDADNDDDADESCNCVSCRLDRLEARMSDIEHKRGMH